MNQVIIGTGALRAALLTLRTRAENAEDPAGYYEGGIDVLTALLPEVDVAEAAPAIPATSPSIDPRIADAARFAEDHEACRRCGAVYSVERIRSDASGEPTCETCLASLSRTQREEFPWTLPDSEEAFATLDELLPEAVPATPYPVINLVEKRAVWAVMVMIGDAEGQPDGHEWQTFADKASVAQYCRAFLPPTDTIAEPEASLEPASVEEAPPVGQPDAPPPPPPPAAEGEQMPEAERAAARDVAPKRGRQGDRSSPVWPPARIAMLCERYPNEGASPELLAALNGVPAEVEIASLGAVKAKVTALGLRVSPEAAARIAEETAAKARAALAEQRAAKAAPTETQPPAPTAEPAGAAPELSAPDPAEQPEAKRPRGHALPATVTAEDEVKAEVFDAFNKGLSVRDIAADFGEPVAKLSAWRAEWTLKQKQESGAA